MKGRVRWEIAVATVLLAAFASLAQGAALSQWKDVKSSLRDLIANGYTVVAVTHEAGTASAYTDTFFLQKGASLHRCIEFQLFGAKGQETAAMFTCAELVQPYALPPKQ